MPPSRELKNLPGCLAEAGRWNLTPEELTEQVAKISVRFEWAAPEPVPARVSFFRWVLTDRARCPALHLALTERSLRYLSDPAFHHKTFAEWLAFCNAHGVFESEFRPAWRRWSSSQRRSGLTLVN